MRCEGFPVEQYGLYPLGALENAEASQIADHLDQQCETCLREVRRHIALWSQFGEALSPDVGSPRLMTTPRPLRVRQRPRSPIAQWLAAAAAILLMTGVGYWLALRQWQTRQSSFEAQINTLKGQTAHLSKERDDALRAAQRASRPPVPVQAPALPQSPSGQITAQSNELSRLNGLLKETRQQYEQALRDLGSARSEVAMLQTRLDRQQSELSDARSAQAQLRESVSNSESERRASETRIRSLQAEVSELTKARQQLTATIQSRERQAEQTTNLLTQLSAPGTKLVALRGTEAAPNARAYALISADGRLTLLGEGLPNLPANRTYQLWLMRSSGGPVISGGLVQPVSQRQYRVQFNEGKALEHLRALAVTDEPAGGSPLPTGRKVLIGTV